MAESFCELCGEEARPEDLRLPRARELALRLRDGLIEYAALAECRTQKSDESVVFDVEVELPQIRAYAIERSERIAAEFSSSDFAQPEVLALRSNFPRVPHLNLRDRELPRSLCLYSDSWTNVRRRWTPVRFVARIREWLALTAKGELHQPDQPLEPVFLRTPHRIVLPEEVLAPENGRALEELYVRVLGDPKSSMFLMADPKRPGEHEKSLLIGATVHRSSPVEHGVIYRTPSTLQELVEVTEPCGVALLNELQVALRRWRDKASLEKKEPKLIDALSVVMIVLFPKLRLRDAPQPEATEVHAFFTADDVKTLGSKLGLWEERDGHVAPLLGRADNSRLEEIRIDCLNPCFDFTRSEAARLSGFSSAADSPRIVAIGVGALGSQVFMNLARSGFGTWTVVDDDRLLPHNLARHALGRPYVGHEKSVTASYAANSLLKDDEFSTPLPLDALRPGERADVLSKALSDADIVLDMSADVAVARHLALTPESSARRVSLFLNPTGEDLVLLAEDCSREAVLDSLEMQYYRALVTDQRLHGHFRPSHTSFRYGQSCRDATSILPQDSLGLHAAIASRALRALNAEPAARVSVWRSDAHGNVSRVNVPASKTLSAVADEWTVRADGAFLEKLSRLRRSKLPNETGGVLLGSFDLDRRILYLADTLPSPPDSEEWPTVYIRGCEGLRKQVDAYAANTDGCLEYSGEWHSHPAATDATPSADDHKVFTWIAETMAREGLPPVMLIVAENNACCFVGKPARPAAFSLPQD